MTSINVSNACVGFLVSGQRAWPFLNPWPCGARERVNATCQPAYVQGPVASWYSPNGFGCWFSIMNGRWPGGTAVCCVSARRSLEEGQRNLGPTLSPFLCISLFAF